MFSRVWNPKKVFWRGPVCLPEWQNRDLHRNKKKWVKKKYFLEDGQKVWSIVYHWPRYFRSSSRKHFFSYWPGEVAKNPEKYSKQLSIYCCYTHFFRFRVNHDFVTPGDTPVPVKTLFLDFRPRKTHIAPKNNSKQLLRRCCYTHFFSFPCKSRFRHSGRHTGPRENTFFGFQTRENTYRSEKQF